MAALATLSPWVGFTSVVAAHSIGRSAAASAAALSAKAAKKDLGVDYVSEISRLRSLFGIAAGSAIPVPLTGSVGLLLLAFAIPATVLVCIWSHRSVGGIAGDSLGAIAQLSQTSVLFGAVVLNDGVCACSW
jgi:cobalamin synthase